MTGHSWSPVAGSAGPALRCINRGCQVVWHSDRLEPKSRCKGTPVEETAARFVRALMIDGGA